MTTATSNIRCAHPHELPELQAVDMAACQLFEPLGLSVNLPEGHPFVVAETERWTAALERRHVVVAVSGADTVLAFAVYGRQDGLPYLDQVSVHPNAMRRGLGRSLLDHVIAKHEGEPLWLTTYAHVAWNAPYYQRFGFMLVADSACGPELRTTLALQRAALPAPERRVAMVRPPRTPQSAQGSPT